MIHSVPSPTLIPRDVLFGNPTKANPQLSPDGRFLSYLAPLNGVLNVWVGPAGGEEYKAVTQDNDRGIRFYFWGYDNEHILYVQDVGGNENWRLYSVNLSTSETRDLTPFENVQVNIVKHSKDHPNEILIALNKENPAAHDVYLLKLSSGTLELVAKNPGNIVHWVTDGDLNVRGAVASTPDGGTDLLLYGKDGEWNTFLSWDMEDSMASRPVGFTKDNREMYLIDSRHVNAGRLIQMKLSDQSFRIIAEDPQYDVEHVMTDPETYEVLAVSFNKQRKEWVVQDDSIKEDFVAIRKLHDGDFSIHNRDAADRTWLIGFHSDTGPASYYIYNRETREGTFLFHNKPELAEYELMPMKPISFTSRDGLTIHGYITYPPGNRTKLPLVLNVHGGPWSRDSWGFDPEAQWLANRGYACLSVNFRGSTGYGKNFLNAGNKEWAGAMHNDLVDAVNWAVDQGIADPGKVAIYGGSYGGYAALVGATFTPDLFCCAVDVVGPSNIITLIQSIPPYWTPMLAALHKRVGHPELEEDFLKSRSPIYKVDQIKIPILIAQGANDPRVKQAESEQIVAAMKEKNLEYEYLLFPDEGHGFAKPENRLKFYERAEKFLARNLNGRYEE
ncbi:alpha/beta fold hydrolase [Paenibacillus tarimensis]